MMVYGASGHAKVIIELILSKNGGAIDQVFDDNPEIKEVLGHKVRQPKKGIFTSKKNMVIAIGNNQIRKKLSKTLRVDFVEPLVHNSAIVSPSAKIEKGCVVMANATINAEARIGKHCIINTGSVIEHDVVLRDYVHISPNASIAGGVTVEEGSHVGTGASVIPGKTIGKWATVGAGSVIIEDVPDFAVVVGNPGKILRFNDEYYD